MLLTKLQVIVKYVLSFVMSLNKYFMEQYLVVIKHKLHTNSFSSFMLLNHFLCCLSLLFKNLSKNHKFNDMHIIMSLVLHDVSWRYF